MTQPCPRDGRPGSRTPGLPGGLSAEHPLHLRARVTRHASQGPGCPFVTQTHRYLGPLEKGHHFCREQDPGRTADRLTGTRGSGSQTGRWPQGSGHRPGGQLRGTFGSLARDECGWAELRPPFTRRSRDRSVRLGEPRRPPRGAGPPAAGPSRVVAALFSGRPPQAPAGPHPGQGPSPVVCVCTRADGCACARALRTHTDVLVSVCTCACARASGKKTATL